MELKLAPKTSHPHPHNYNFTQNIWERSRQMELLLKGDIYTSNSCHLSLFGILFDKNEWLKAEVSPINRTLSLQQQMFHVCGSVVTMGCRMTGRTTSHTQALHSTLPLLQFLGILVHRNIQIKNKVPSNANSLILFINWLVQFIMDNFVSHKLNLLDSIFFLADE